MDDVKNGGAALVSVALFLFAIWGAWNFGGPLDQPSPRGRIEIQKPQPDTAKHHDRANRPAPPGDQSKPTKDTDSKKDHAAHDWGSPEAAIFYATLGLFVVTGALARYTAHLFHSTKKIAEDADKASKASLAVSAKSADVAEKALTVLEAPMLFVAIEASGIKYQPDATQKFRLKTLTYRIANHGRTIAHLIHVSDRIEPVPDGGGWPEALRMDNFILPWGVIAPPQGVSELRSRSLLIHLFGEKQDLFYQNHTAVFFQVAIRYRDIFDAVYDSGFCFMFDPLTDRFVLSAAGEEYNYCRKVKGADHDAPAGRSPWPT